MGRFSAPSPFSQAGTANLYSLGFTFGAHSQDSRSMSWSGPSDVPRWSRSAAKRALRLAGQTRYMSPARLKEVMQILGLTRHDLAAAAGIKVGLVRDWLSGRRDVWPYIGQVLETDVKTVCVD